MITDFLPYLKFIFDSSFGWFTSLLGSLEGSVTVILAAFLMLLIVRYILSPLLSGGGVGASDKAYQGYQNKKKKETGD